MAGLIDQIVQDLVRQIGQQVRQSVSNSGGSGSVSSNPPLQTLQTLQGASTPPYQPTGGGLGPSAAGTAAGWVSAKAANAVIASFPSTQQAVQMQLANMQARAFSFSPGTTYGQVEMAAQRMTELGTATSTTDASVALQRAGLMGFGGAQMGSLRKTLQSISNVMPGLGLSGAEDAYYAMQQGQNVNMAKLIGVQLRDRSGAPKSIDDIVEQLWRSLNQRKNVGRAITTDDIRFALLPGNSLDFTLSQYFGNDPDLRQTVIQMLYAKAKGAKNFSKEEMRRVGITTDAVTSQANKTAQQLKVQQGTEGAVVSGFEHATDAVGLFGDAISHVTALLGPLLEAGGFAAGFRADGGPVSSNKTYIVGEKGPEVFVPTQSGTIIPNHAISAKNAMLSQGRAKQSSHTEDNDFSSHTTSNVTTKTEKTVVNYGGVTINMTVSSTETGEKMARELRRALSLSNIEKNARIK